jgi:chromosomal replication initiation ATPase DnaA
MIKGITKMIIRPDIFVGIHGYIHIPSSNLRHEVKIEKAKNIINACILYYKLNGMDDFLKWDRSSDRMMARHVAAYLIKMNTGLAESQFCHLFNRDRTTCLNSVMRVKGFLEVNNPPQLVYELRDIMNMI